MKSKNSLWNYSLKPRVLLCGSSGADVIAESDSSWTTRPLMETLCNTEQQQQQQQRQRQNTKEIREMCQPRHDLSPTIRNGTQPRYQQSFPILTHQCCSRIIFVPTTNQSNHASEKKPKISCIHLLESPRHHKPTSPGGPLTTTRLSTNSSYRVQTYQNNEHDQRAHLTDDTHHSGMNLNFPNACVFGIRLLTTNHLKPIEISPL
jgi:hypothetical protein